MKIKTLFVMLFMAFLWAANSFGAPADLNKYHYQGIGKIPGQPIDSWVDFLFDDTDIEINVSDTYNFAASYKATKVGDKITISLKAPGRPATTLTSTDSGSTLTGKLALYGQTLDLWLLKVPRRLKPAAIPASELEGVIGSEDGYTAFVLIGLADGKTMCATSDFLFNPADKSFKMTCDSPSLQKIFSTMQGTYSVQGSDVVLTDSTGKTVKGTAYDDGYYIKVPLGSASGITLTLVLIR